MKADGKTKASEYLRVSDDRSGRARSIDEQHHDNVAAWPDLDLECPYVDTSIPASRFSDRARPGFDDLVADLRAGQFPGNVLALSEASRGSRRVGDWVDLLDAAEVAGVKIAVTTHNRSYEPQDEPHRRRETPAVDDRALRRVLGTALGAHERGATGIRVPRCPA